MSAFNKARYNVARYNVNSGGAVWLTGSASASFGFRFAGETFYCQGNARASFEPVTLRLDKGFMARGSAAETFAHTSKALSYSYLRMNAAETFDVEALNLSQIINADGIGAEAFETDTNLSQIINADGTGSASVDTGRCELGQIIFESADCGEVFASTVDVIALTEFVCEFPDLVLKPGQTLVIDASTFNVLLDGENAIHLQKGDWLDDMNRNTQSITITGTGASRLTAEILYTERFL